MPIWIISVIKEEPSNNNNKDVLELDNNHVSIENNLSDAAFSDDEEDELPIRMYSIQFWKDKVVYVSR